MAIDQLGDVGRDHPVLGDLGATRSTEVRDVLSATCRRAPPLYPDGDLTDEPEAVMVAELVREAALEGVRDELPHSLAVVVEEMVAREGRPRRRARCSTCASTSSSSGPARRPSSSARAAPGCATSARRPARRSRRCSASAVYLDLHVKVAKDWQRDPKQLQRLGF